MKYVGERLKEVMTMRGIKASKMAKDLNLGRGHISNIVTGRIQSPKKHLASIAAYLNVSQSWLLTGEGNAEEVLHAEIPVYCMKDGDNILLGHYKLPMNIDGNCYGILSAPSFPAEMLIVVDPNKKGDGFYLVEGDVGPVLAYRFDHTTHLEWLYLSHTPPKKTTLIGKVEALINQETYKYAEIENY